MAKESNLKKEFAPKDVQRMRNLLTGKAGEKTGIQSGYEKSRQNHIEGDVWEENMYLYNAQKAKYIMKAVFPFVVLSACGPSSPSFGPALGDDFHIFKIFTFEVN